MENLIFFENLTTQHKSKSPKMIHLISLKGTTINLPYHPDMPLWQYLRDVIAPAAKFECS